MSREGDTLGATQAPVSTVPSELPDLPVLDEQRFRLGEERARGGIGRIVEAEDQLLGRRIAVKQLIAAGNDDDRTRFVREAMLTARLSHPAIVPIYDAGVRPSGEPFYAMPFVAGGSLLAAIAAASGLDGRLALLPHVQAVADAMAYAHEQHIVHRDLKPANVLVGAFGETVLIDWGLAKDTRTGESPAGRSGFAPLTEQVSATRTGDVIGTPAYMSPEQARGELVDEKSDVYALGGMLYHLLAGRAPHGDARGPLAGPPAPLPPNAPVELVAICRKAMAAEPSLRYPSARELAVELRRFQTGQLVAAHVYRRRERLARFVRRNRAPLAVAFVSLALLAAFAAFSFLRITEERNVARAAEHEAAARRDLLTLAQARTALSTDPGATLAWLRTLPDAAAGGEEAQALAALAESRGVPRHVIGGDGTPVTRVAVSPGEPDRLVALGGAGLALRLVEPSTGKVLRLLDPGVELAGMLYAPDGSAVFAAGRDGNVHVWDTRTYAHRAFASGSPVVSALAFVPDASRLAVGTTDGLVRLFTPAGEKLAELAGHAKGITTLAFSPDGKTLVSGSHDRDTRLWDLASGQSRVLSQHAGWPAVSFSPDGRHIMSAAISDRRIFLTDTASGKTRPIELPTYAWQTAWKPDSKLLAWGGMDRMVHMIAVDGGELSELPGEGHRDEVVRVTWSPDGQLLASVDQGRAVLWHVNAYRSVALLGHTNKIMGAAFSSDSRTLVTWSEDGTLRVWRTAYFDHDYLEGYRWAIADLAFSPDGQRLAYGTEDGKLGIWRPGDPEPEPPRPHREEVTRVVWTPDGSAVVSIGRDGLLRRLRVADGQVETIGEGLRNLVATPDGKVMAALGNGATGRVVRLENGTLRELVGEGPPLVVLAISADGRVLTWGSADGRLWRWDGALAQLPPLPGELLHLALSSDGSELALASPDGVVRVRGREEAKLELGGAPTGLRYAGDALLAWSSGGTIVRRDAAGERRFHVAAANPLEVELSPDGKLLAAACDDTTVRVWDLVSGGHRARVSDRFFARAIAFAPDGRLAASGGDLAVFPRPGEKLVPRGAAPLRAWIDAQTTGRLDPDRPERPLASPPAAPGI